MKGWRLLAISAVAGLLTVTSAPAQVAIKVLFWGGTTTTPHHPTALRDTLANYFPAFNIQMDYRSANVPVWLHADTLAQYDVILVYTTHNTSQAANDLGQVRLTALTDWINSGRVMVALHGSTNTYTMGNSTVTAAWRALLGAQYTGHGPLNTSGTVTRTALGENHACLQGTTMLPTSAANTGGMPYWDEGREHINFANDTIVLARSQTASSNFPWIWVREQGQGWVYYNASGHDGQVWSRTEFRNQIIRALTWGHQVKTTGIRGRAALELFLNAPHGHIEVPFKAGHSIEILDMQGRRVFHRSRSHAPSHDVNFLPAGTYGVNILSEASEAFKGLYVKPR